MEGATAATEAEIEEEIVTGTVSVSSQTPFVPTTVYVVFTVGLAIGFGQLVQLNPVAGVHVNEVVPVAIKF